MKKYTVFLSAVLCLTVVAAYAQSLGDFAREEQKRRDAIPDDRTITLKSAPITVPYEDNEKKEVLADDEYAYDETEDPQDADAEDDEEDYEYPAEEMAEPDEATDLYGKTESYWRNTMSDARNKLREMENEAKELSSRHNALQSQHNRTNRARRGPIDNELDKTRQAQELNRKNLEQARKELQSLQNAARSSGALPGWLE